MGTWSWRAATAGVPGQSDVTYTVLEGDGESGRRGETGRVSRVRGAYRRDAVPKVRVEVGSVGGRERVAPRRDGDETDGVPQGAEVAGRRGGPLRVSGRDPTGGTSPDATLGRGVT